MDSPEVSDPTDSDDVLAAVMGIDPTEALDPADEENYTFSFLDDAYGTVMNEEDD